MVRLDYFCENTGKHVADLLCEENEMLSLQKISTQLAELEPVISHTLATLPAFHIQREKGLLLM
jgi:hypothetical protein